MKVDRPPRETIVYLDHSKDPELEYGELTSEDRKLKLLEVTGYVVFESDECVTIALGRNMQEENDYCGKLTLATKLIRKRTLLGEKRAKRRKSVDKQIAQLKEDLAPMMGIPERPND